MQLKITHRKQPRRAWEFFNLCQSSACLGRRPTVTKPWTTSRAFSLIKTTVTLIWNKGSILFPLNKNNNINMNHSKWVRFRNKSSRDTETLMTFDCRKQRAKSLEWLTVYVGIKLCKDKQQAELICLSVLLIISVTFFSWFICGTITNQICSQILL